ncbi:TVP38/TMEM64 family protein [Thioalkalivibrio sp. ALM2T]|uniref:TVP38/TMEM64 family protein n=1 Tax=Thioalkalivibrio sp. ALM2T TaxID=1158184 RepID=UPI00036AAAD0|nr:VTT domain-containing protein [Thioalkalivibrio sp. ALM2T]
MTHPRPRPNGCSRANIGRGLLVLLIALGIGIALWVGDPVRLLAWGDAVAGGPWATAGLVLLMALMLTFALPGTLILWLIAPFHPPLLAIGLLLAGSVSGAWGAYRVSARLARHTDQERREDAWLADFLHRHSGLATQIALRVLPGFPHSMVNYAAGALGLPLGRFLLAAVLGLAVKWSVYATAIHGTTDALASGKALQPQTLLPLFVLAMLLLLGAALRHRIQRRHSRRIETDE